MPPLTPCAIFSLRLTFGYNFILELETQWLGFMVVDIKRLLAHFTLEFTSHKTQQRFKFEVLEKGGTFYGKKLNKMSEYRPTFFNEIRPNNK